MNSRTRSTKRWLRAGFLHQSIGAAVPTPPLNKACCLYLVLKSTAISEPYVVEVMVYFRSDIVFFIAVYDVVSMVPGPSLGHRDQAILFITNLRMQMILVLPTLHNLLIMPYNTKVTGRLVDGQGLPT